ncbi:MAG TPA: hypothetical protein VLT62_16200 [Candidatus Methylomirabilis sp.]|nr:hypothetical protein [Candidatus Methylomirabilis sp.]
MSTQPQGCQTNASAPVDALASLTRRRPVSTAAAYLLPAAVATVAACFVMISGAGPFETTPARLGLGGGILLAGLAAGALAGRAASSAERRAFIREYEQRLDDLDHDLRAPMTIIRGEVELVLSQEDIPVAERRRSSTAIIERLETLEALLRRRYRE